MTAKRPSTLLLSGPIARFVVSSAIAQATTYTSIEVPAGKPVQLSCHAFGEQELRPGAAADRSR
jgi:hypothetical protein